MDETFRPVARTLATLSGSPSPIQGIRKSAWRPPEGMIFRGRESADTSDLFDLFNERSFLENASTHGRFASREEFEGWLDGIAPAGKYEVVAEIGGKVVAFGGLYAFTDLMSHCGSVLLGVREDWQNRKIGSTILHTLVMTAELMAGLSKIHLTVFADNTPALRLYREFGFEVEGLLRRFSRRGEGFADAYSMALFLDELAPASHAA